MIKLSYKEINDFMYVGNNTANKDSLKDELYTTLDEFIKSRVLHYVKTTQYNSENYIPDLIQECWVYILNMLMKYVPKKAKYTTILQQWVFQCLNELGVFSGVYDAPIRQPWDYYKRKKPKFNKKIQYVDYEQALFKLGEKRRDD